MGLKDISEMIREIEEDEKAVGGKLRNRIADAIPNYNKSQIRSLKEHSHWFKEVFKQFEWLLAKNPDKVYIHNMECFSTDLDEDSMMPDGWNLKGGDICVYLPKHWWSRKLYPRWIFTVDCKEMFKYACEESQSWCGQCPPINPDDNLYKWDHIYVDMEDIDSEEKVLMACRQWFDIFYPEFSDKLVFKPFTWDEKDYVKI